MQVKPIKIRITTEKRLAICQRDGWDVYLDFLGTRIHIGTVFNLEDVKEIIDQCVLQKEYPYPKTDTTYTVRD